MRTPAARASRRSRPPPTGHHRRHGHQDDDGHRQRGQHRAPARSRSSSTRRRRRSSARGRPPRTRNGWNNTDVTVSFAPSDATLRRQDLIGPDDPGRPAPRTSRSPARSPTTPATRRAPTVSGINIDKVAPTLSGAPTTSPNAAGWYNGDVTVAWTAADALSGTTQPGEQHDHRRGHRPDGQRHRHRQGRQLHERAVSAPVKIDRTAPTTTVTAPPALEQERRHADPRPERRPVRRRQDVLPARRRRRRPPAPACPVTAEGNHTLKFWSTDVAGNAEAAHTVSFGIDKTSPTIGHTQTPAANADGWNNANVTVTFTCSDALSGVASCTGPQTVTTEGKAQAVTGTVRQRRQHGDRPGRGEHRQDQAGHHRRRPAGAERQRLVRRRRHRDLHRLRRPVGRQDARTRRTPSARARARPPPAPRPTRPATAPR